MVTIASSLGARGYDVTFVTSDVFRSQIEAAGLMFIPLLKDANFDYRFMDSYFPERRHIPAGLSGLTYDFQHIFINAIPDQFQTIQNVMRNAPVDLILTDTTFLGAFPLLLNETARRPPVISCGITTLFITSRDRPPVGAPSLARPDKRLYLQEHRDFQAALKPIDDHLAKVLNSLHVKSPRSFIMDAINGLPDRYLQLTGEAFEYPCSDLPQTVRFVGPVTPQPSLQPEEDFAWCNTLDVSRPVVLVTQGTIANSDFSELLEPALQALSEDDVIVVASLGTACRQLSIAAPSNAHVVPYIPFTTIMPKVSLFVTNGGYGSVNQALQYGVPMVVAGTTEDKSFVAARVAWSGSGLDLQTQRPAPQQIRTAVRAVLGDASYKRNAERIAANFRQYQALDRIAAEVELQLRGAFKEEERCAALPVASC